MFTNRTVLALVVALSGALVARADEHKYMTIVEPNEKAFSFLLPEGWHCKGGLVRPSLLGYSVAMLASSPDGQVQVGRSDLFPLYAVPAPGGYPVGTRYSPGMGVIAEIQPYLPAAKFLTQVVIPQRVGKFTVTRVVNRTDLAKPAFLLPGVVAADAAEVEYRFERDGKPYQGGLLCTTGMSRSGSFLFWRVGIVEGYEAPVDRVDEAKSAMVLAVMTCRLNPIWVNAELKGSADREKIIERLTHQRTAAIVDAYWQRARTMESIFKRDSDVRRGTVDLYDPTTGTVLYGRTNKYDYYWQNVRGNVVGTNTDTSPGVDYHRLAVLP
jgi:hypothetical protein